MFENYGDEQTPYSASDAIIAQLAIASAKFSGRYPKAWRRITAKDILEWLPYLPPRSICVYDTEDEATNGFLAKNMPINSLADRHSISFKWPEIEKKNWDELHNTPVGRIISELLIKYAVLNQHLNRTRRSYQIPLEFQYKRVRAQRHHALSCATLWYELSWKDANYRSMRGWESPF
ncbi:MAG: hypothetical protein AAF550_00550 [Myxococcota bacterium]